MHNSNTKTERIVQTYTKKEKQELQEEAKIIDLNLSNYTKCLILMSRILMRQRAGMVENWRQYIKIWFDYADNWAVIKRYEPSYQFAEDMKKLIEKKIEDEKQKK